MSFQLITTQKQINTTTHIVQMTPVASDSTAISSYSETEIDKQLHVCGGRVTQTDAVPLQIHPMFSSIHCSHAGGVHLKRHGAWGGPVYLPLGSLGDSSGMRPLELPLIYLPLCSTPWTSRVWGTATLVQAVTGRYEELDNVVSTSESEVIKSKCGHDALCSVVFF